MFLFRLINVPFDIDIYIFPNRNTEGGRSRSQTPESLSSPDHSNNGMNLTSPTLQQKLRAIGGVPTPFAVSASPIVRRSNPPTPTHPGRDYIGMFHPGAGVPSNPRLNAGPYYEPYNVANNEQRRFLSENELLYERQYQSSGLAGGNSDSSGPIRELASSPQRSVYQWKDNSPTAGPSGSSNFGLLQNYCHSNPPSPVQHNNVINNSANSGSATMNNMGYYHPSSTGNYMLGKSVPPVSPNVKYSTAGQEGIRPSPINRRPVSFVRALEMTDSMEVSNRGQNTRNSPAGTPKGLTQQSFNENPERASVYDMNYEISV